MIAVVLVAAGVGSRAGPGAAKQYRQIGGTPVVARTLSALARSPDIGLIVPVIASDDRHPFESAVGPMRIALAAPVIGGATRQHSVHAGLEALASRRPTTVLVHDAARPFPSVALIARAIAASKTSKAAIPVLPITDTVKSVHPDGGVAATVDRASLRLVQTPQVFDFETLLAAHRRAAEAARYDFTDDAALMEWAGERVSTFAGEPGNIKLTTAEDFVQAEAHLAAALTDIRIGSGYDVHAFAQGTHVTIGGISIPHDRGLTGHSDADVGLHALVDAILGALADGDIGSHFPPSDPQWRGASSDRFLEFAAKRVRARGGMIAHLDLTIICEMPKIDPHRDAMRRRIAEVAGLALDRVAVKATTSEQLGFTGRREGIAASATATVRLPWSADDAG